MERIQPLLRAEDYDLEISDVEFGAHEPPLYAFVISEQAIKLLPTEVFSAHRLFRRLEPDGGSVWIRALIFNELVHYIPRECFSRDILLTKYNPSEDSRTPFAEMLASEQTRGIYPQIVSSEDIKLSEAFPDIVAHVMACHFTTCLQPEDFASHYDELKEIWTPLRDYATPEAKEWFGEVTKALLKAFQRG